jgi:lysophospholipase L1-like esterase
MEMPVRQSCFSFEVISREGTGPGSLEGFSLATMKIRLLAMLALLAVPAAALEPNPRPDPERFAGEIAAFAKGEPETGGIVFAGSSSIRRWTSLKEDFEGLPVINRGFGGSVANDLIVHFETVIARHAPKLLVIYTGGNDIALNIPVDEALADYVKFLTIMRVRFPKTPVILTSVKIAPQRAAQIAQVHELNQRLGDWAADKEWLRFVDCTSYLADEKGMPNVDYFIEDMIHLNAEGYARWREILDPVLREEWQKVK